VDYQAIKQAALTVLFCGVALFPLQSPAETKDSPYKLVYKALVRQIEPLKAEGGEKYRAEILKGGRRLIKEFPDETRSWTIILHYVELTPNREEKLGLLREMAALPEKTHDYVKRRAECRLLEVESLGKPLDIKFTAVDGRQVDLTKTKGKVVLVYFCASWCPPCVKEYVGIKAVYDKYHDQGFEVVGISLDQNEEQFKRYTAAKKIPWPQHFEGNGFTNSIAVAQRIISIPTLWLVDKNGNLVDRSARGDLEEKVKKLLSGD
jgi:thiol-disulfide isomerase/thioredoxin